MKNYITKVTLVEPLRYNFYMQAVQCYPNKSNLSTFVAISGSTYSPQALTVDVNPGQQIYVIMESDKVFRVSLENSHEVNNSILK